MTCPGAVLERWLGTLSEYDFEVQHRAGTKHGNVDGLSRGGYAEAADQERSQPPISLPSTLSGPRLRRRRCSWWPGWRWKRPSTSALPRKKTPTFNMVRQWLADRRPPDKL